MKEPKSFTKSATLPQTPPTAPFQTSVKNLATAPIFSPMIWKAATKKSLRLTAPSLVTLIFGASLLKAITRPLTASAAAAIARPIGLAVAAIDIARSAAVVALMPLMILGPFIASMATPRPAPATAATSRLPAKASRATDTPPAAPEAWLKSPSILTTLLRRTVND
ncbi:hypothetical protein D3C85_1254080 [compost metagenome]